MENKNLYFNTNPSIKRYSLAFKKNVVKEVESGQLTKDGAKRKYNIGGNTTVLRWCRQYGTHKLNGTQVIIAMANEKQISDKQRIRELEKALANAHLKIRAQDTLIDVAERDLNIKIRKKPGTKQ